VHAEKLKRFYKRDYYNGAKESMETVYQSKPKVEVNVKKTVTSSDSSSSSEDDVPADVVIPKAMDDRILEVPMYTNGPSKQFEAVVPVSVKEKTGDPTSHIPIDKSLSYIPGIKELPSSTSKIISPRMKGLMQKFKPKDVSSRSASSNRTNSSSSSESDKPVKRKAVKPAFEEKDRIRGRSRKRAVKKYYSSSASGSLSS
jgi:hypothetical protein